MAIRVRSLALRVVKLILGVALLSGAETAWSQEWRLIVKDVRPVGGQTPVVVEVPATITPGSYIASQPGGSLAFMAQVFEDDGKTWLASVLPAGAADGTFRLHHRGDIKEQAPSGVVLDPNGSKISFRLDQHVVTEYRTDVGAKPFLFPLVGPTGASYTRAYPMESMPGEDRDHPHQRSFWFTHGKVNGVDFWSEEGGHGRIGETSRKTIVSGPVIGRLRTTNVWLGPESRFVCDDERVITCYKVDNVRVIDFEITLKANYGPVTFGDTKEGMFGLRVASSMDVDKKRGGRIINAEGLTDDQAWGKASAWVDYMGPVQGQIVGITILNHPRSFRYPTNWHVRTYGLFAANPFGWHDFGLGKSGEYVLQPGQTIWFGYRLILHAGEISSARIGEAFESYRNPPLVEVKAN